jgi:hypothetical protein
MTQAFGIIGRGKKLHFAHVKDATVGWKQGHVDSDQWESGCMNHGGDYIGKSISYIYTVVEFDGQNDLYDQQLSVEALEQQKPHITEADICYWCYWARSL